jgi:mRNA interferase RelE/StbE
MAHPPRQWLSLTVMVALTYRTGGSIWTEIFIKKIEEMCDNLKGDVKHLTDSTPEYRLRVGDYRVLFEIEGETIIVYRVRHRREAYR